MRRFLVIGLGVVMLFSLCLGACTKKEEPPVPQAPQMIPQAGPMAPAGQMPPGGQMPPAGQMPQVGQMPPGGPMPPAGMGMPRGEMKVVVPESVKGKWSAVKIVVEDKISKKTQEFTVKLNSEFKIPNSDLKVAVGEFLPDFKMVPDQITSSSNMPNNPAVAIKVFEGGKQIFPAAGKKWGWLYARPELRNIHPFEHPKFALSLQEGIKKG